MLKKEPVYYNEIDKYAVQWLRNLIEAGHIAYGIVDDRSIVDVTPSDLAGFRQCHFFAGIGVWSYALRRAGVPDDADLWTGSCPCQPFSAAGAGAGMDDERHLWPHFHHLIRACRPPRVLGEQVASKDADPWIDLVQDDTEAMGYGVWSCPFPAAGIGAPHIRDRLYWVAHAGRARAGRHARATPGAQGGVRGTGHPDGRELGDAPVAGGAVRGLADSDSQRRDGFDPLLQWHSTRRVEGHCLEVAGSGPTNGLWRDADWLACRDGRWRPVEPGTFPLAHGAPARVGRLRAYGNAIVAEAAVAFIESVMTC